MIVVIGLGQSLRGDDEAGLIAVRHWVEAYPSESNCSSIRVELAESPGLNLLNLMSGAEVAILVDAVQSGRAPGTLHVLSDADLGAFQGGADSAHGWGVAETLALGRSTDPDSLPNKLVMVGIEIKQVQLGAGLSPAVENAIPQVVRVIQKLVKESIND